MQPLYPVTNPEVVGVLAGHSRVEQIRYTRGATMDDVTSLVIMVADETSNAEVAAIARTAKAAWSEDVPLIRVARQGAEAWATDLRSRLAGLGVSLTDAMELPAEAVADI